MRVHSATIPRVSNLTAVQASSVFIIFGTLTGLVLSYHDGITGHLVCKNVYLLLNIGNADIRAIHKLRRCGLRIGAGDTSNCCVVSSNGDRRLKSSLSGILIDIGLLERLIFSIITEDRKPFKFQDFHDLILQQPKLVFIIKAGLLKTTGPLMEGSKHIFRRQVG